MNSMAHENARTPATFNCVGLDWINKSEGWAYCRLVGTKTQCDLTLGTLPVGETALSPLLREAEKIVLDAPIGLVDDHEKVCKARPCDLGAKKWIGAALQSSVFVPPTIGELQRWRDTDPKDRAKTIESKGHFRGLLPAIDSAETIFDLRPEDTLESHPELVFSAIAAKPLPETASKSTLFGLLVRLGLLAKRDRLVTTLHIASLNRIAADNFLDAIAMALVAEEWAGSADISVIGDQTGDLQSLTSRNADRRFLMSVLTPSGDARGQAPPSIHELAFIAQSWLAAAQSSAVPISMATSE